MQLRVTFTMAGLLLLCGCPGSLDDIARYRVDGGGLASPLDGGPVDCPTALPQTLTGTCAAAGCHSGAIPAGSLDLTAAPDLRERLRNKPSFGAPAILLIDTKDYTKSALYTKTANPPPYGFTMPPTGLPLNEATRTCILEFIKATPAPAVDGGPSDGAVTDAAKDAAGD